MLQWEVVGSWGSLAHIGCGGATRLSLLSSPLLLVVLSGQRKAAEGSHRSMASSSIANIKLLLILLLVLGGVLVIVVAAGSLAGVLLVRETHGYSKLSDIKSLTC